LSLKTKSMTPRMLAAAMVVAYFAALDPLSAFGQGAVYVVRHAEKLNEAEDSPLSAEGMKRAEHLAKLLKNGNIKAIYTSDALRTRQTAQPLANANHLLLNVIAGGDPNLTAMKIRADHPHDAVLIVGHSNTVGAMVKKWREDAEITIGPNDFDQIFVVIPGACPAGWVRFRYGVNDD